MRQPGLSCHGATVALAGMPSTPLAPPQLPAHPPAWRQASGPVNGAAPPASMQIPFNSSLSLHHGPSSVSFGFGCGSTFGGNNSAMLESPAGTSSAAARASPIDVHAGAARASAKRTRDGSDEEDQDTSHTGLSADLSASLDAGVEAMDLAAHASPESKRRRAAVPPATSPSAGATDEASRRAPVAHGEHRRGARTSRTHMPVSYTPLTLPTKA